MTYICSPDSSYIMESSFDLLEMTPDVPISTYLSGFNLDYYFDTYDAHYMNGGASPAIKNLSSLMYEWVDNQDEKTRAIALSENIYSVDNQFKELILGTTNKLIKSFLNNQGIVDKNNSFIGAIDIPEDQELNIMDEKDIYFPANIGSALINSNRNYDYILNIKNQLKKTIETKVPLADLQKHFKSFESIKKSFEIESNIIKPNKLETERNIQAKKAIKKGINKFTNLFGEKNIKSFISGDGFTVEGKLYKWNFSQRKNVSILSMTHSPMKYHIPYILTLMTKDDIVLSNCCVYVENNTPIIDQIITIMLYIQHDEEELLKNCNLFNRSPEVMSMKEDFNNKKIFSNDQPRIELFNNFKYDNKFIELNKKYLPIITEQFSKIIGIEYNFFKLLISNNKNPILSDSKSIYFLDEFKNTNNIINI